MTSDPPLSLDTVIVASPSQVSCQIQDEVAILQLEAGVYYGLDPVGARIWELLAEPRPLRAVRDALLAEYDVDAERCERDLVGLVGELLRAGLVEVRGAAPA